MCGNFISVTQKVALEQSFWEKPVNWIFQIFAQWKLGQPISHSPCPCFKHPHWHEVIGFMWPFLPPHNARGPVGGGSTRPNLGRCQDLSSTRPLCKIHMIINVNSHDHYVNLWKSLCSGACTGTSPLCLFFWPLRNSGILGIVPILLPILKIGLELLRSHKFLTCTSPGTWPVPSTFRDRLPGWTSTYTGTLAFLSTTSWY
jgi:hypothetical protein